MDWMDDEMVTERPVLPPDHPANKPTESTRQLASLLRSAVRVVVPGDTKNDFEPK